MALPLFWLQNPAAPVVNPVTPTRSVLNCASLLAPTYPSSGENVESSPNPTPGIVTTPAVAVTPALTLAPSLTVSLAAESAALAVAPALITAAIADDDVGGLEGFEEVSTQELTDGFEQVSELVYPGEPSSSAAAEYHVKEDKEKKWYAVIRGLEVGVFLGW